MNDSIKVLSTYPARFGSASVRCLLILLCLAGFDFAAAQTPVRLTFSDLTPVYTGSSKVPTVFSDPEGLSVSLTFTDPATTPPLNTVFRSTPDPVGTSYQSISFAQFHYRGMGKYTRLAGSARYLDSVETVMTTFAKASSWPTLAAQNPAGYYHPVRMHIFRLAADFSVSYFTEITQQVLIPWVPAGLNSLSFEVKFNFPGNLVLPNDVALMVSYNTRTTGFNPIGTAGPYDTLNLSVNTVAPTTGTDLIADSYFYFTQANEYQRTGGTAYFPMFKVNASAAPAAAIATPVNAGSYEVTATVTSPGYSGQATSAFTILAAPVTVSLGNLTHVVDGSAKSATVTTTPAGRATSVTYNGSATAPSAIGRYQVVASVTNPNYTGSATGELQIGYDFAAWIQQYVTAGTIQPGEAGDLADPDGDSLSNLLEYALGLDPASPDHSAAPLLETSAGNLALIYQRNLDALDLSYQVESSTDLHPDHWTDVATTDTVISTAGSIETVQASLPISGSEPNRFLRLKVTR